MPCRAENSYAMTVMDGVNGSRIELGDLYLEP